MYIIIKHGMEAEQLRMWSYDTAFTVHSSWHSAM